MDCDPPGSIIHGDSPGKDTGVCCYFLLEGIFQTQGSNPGLPTLQVDSSPSEPLEKDHLGKEHVSCSLLKNFSFALRKYSQNLKKRCQHLGGKPQPGQFSGLFTLVRNAAWPALEAAQRTDWGEGKSMEIDTLIERIFSQKSTLIMKKFLGKLTNLFLFYSPFMFAKDLHVDNSKRTSLVSIK